MIILIILLADAFRVISRAFVEMDGRGIARADLQERNPCATFITYTQSMIQQGSADPHAAGFSTHRKICQMRFVNDEPENDEAQDFSV